jgi:hypothetical protein
MLLQLLNRKRRTYFLMDRVGFEPTTSAIHGFGNLS